MKGEKEIYFSSKEEKEIFVDKHELFFSVSFKIAKEISFEDFLLL